MQISPTNKSKIQNYSLSLTEESLITSQSINTDHTINKTHKTQSLLFRKGDPVYTRETLSKDYGKKTGENIDKKINQLAATLNKDRKFYLAKMVINLGNNKVFNYYKDLLEATQGDLKELASAKNASRNDKISTFNRVSHEFELETTYNVNLTSKGTTWSEEALNTLDEQLGRLPKKFTTGDNNLHTIEMAIQDPGKGGYNTGKGFISLAPGASSIKWALLHEIGHDFDNENPKWKAFLKLSGWQDVSSQFKSISSDNIKGIYEPYKGSAKLKKDGKVYHDGDKIDLNGDGKIDGIIQVHYGKVMIVKESANFITDYAATNPLDDFAETFKNFFTDRESALRLKQECPEKFKFMVDYTGIDPTKTTVKPPHVLI